MDSKIYGSYYSAKFLKMIGKDGKIEKDSFFYLFLIRVKRT